MFLSLSTWINFNWKLYTERGWGVLRTSLNVSEGVGLLERPLTMSERLRQSAAPISCLSWKGRRRRHVGSAPEATALAREGPRAGPGSSGESESSVAMPRRGTLPHLGKVKTRSGVSWNGLGGDPVQKRGKRAHTRRGKRRTRSSGAEGARARPPKSQTLSPPLSLKKHAVQEPFLNGVFF